jgi:uncharacterized damage-inducible protein DinB
MAIFGECSLKKEKAQMKKCTGILLLGIVALAASPLYAQDATPTTVTVIKQGYEGIKSNIMKAADKMPEDGYAFKPTPEEMSFGGWLNHVAQAQTAICSRAAGAAKNMDTSAKTSKADVQAALKESFDTCDAVYNALTDANSNDSVPSFRGNTTRLATLAQNVIHDNECYGSMAVYLRLKGIVPPSSEGRGRGR